MTTKKHLTIISALAASALFAAPVDSHETRLVGKYPNNPIDPNAVGVNVRVTVGFSGEPAAEDIANNLDLFLYSYDGHCPINTSDFYSHDIATANGDQVNLKVDLLYLKKPAVPTGVTGNGKPATEILKKVTLTDKASLVGGEDPGDWTLDAGFKPTHPSGTESGGAYGFRVYGKIQTAASDYTCDADTNSPTTKTVAAREVNIDTYWICEAGFRVPPGGPASPSSAPVARGQFHCIEAPAVPFPGDARDGYQPNRPYTGWASGHGPW